MPQALIADDQPDVLEALRLLLKCEGYQLDLVNSPRAVLEKLRSRQFDVLLMDLNYAMDTTSGQEGLDLLDGIRQVDSTLPIVVMTAWSSIPLAVEAMRRGARDFVQKPWDNTELLATLRAQVECGRRIEHRSEIQEASITQRGLLPRDFPRLPGLDIAVSWQPASSMSGDYVDVIDTAGGAVALTIADVIGKGMPAALLMSNLQAATRALASELPPADLVRRVNRIMTANTSSGKFITYFYCTLAGRKLRYTNAGHCPPVLLRASGDVERLECGGAVLGVFPEGTYQEGEASLSSGDRLLLFTDGITELENNIEEEFGERRLIQLLCANRRLSASDLQRKIMDEASLFAGGNFRDDATLILLAVA